MPIRRWDPFSDLISLHQELFGTEPQMGRDRTPKSAWAPAVDIYETPESLVIKAELPGVDPNDVKVEYRNRQVVIFGERPAVHEQLKYHRVERSRGPFERRFPLPDCFDCEHIEANFDRGILEIVVPKLPRFHPKCIKVETVP